MITKTIQLNVKLQILFKTTCNYIKKRHCKIFERHSYKDTALLSSRTVLEVKITYYINSILF